MSSVVIVSACRTPIGKTSLAKVPAHQLGGIVVEEAITRAGIGPQDVDEVILGNVISAGLGQAPARQAALAGGLPNSVCATSVNKVCGSGLKAVMIGASMIMSGEASVIVAGGMENMHLAPYILPGAREGYRLWNKEVVDSLVYDGLWCAFEHHHMGNSAEWIANKFGITRREQDEFAFESHLKAIAAQDSGWFDREIVPVGDVKKDECPRRDTSIEALSKLTPAFGDGGTVTAGNSPGITDGAAAVVLMDPRMAKARRISPMARITGFSQVGVPPIELFTAPVLAVNHLMAKTGMTIHDYGLIEANEAFAAQCIANGRELYWDSSRVNVNGGSIALGHPIGASGARILTTLLYALQERDLETGLVTLCLGGGEAVAMSVQL